MLLVFLLSLSISAVLVYFFRRTRVGRVFLDLPKARGLHVAPIPRVGGMAIFGSVWALSFLWMHRDPVAAIAALSLLLFTVSLLDDLRPLPVFSRLLVHGGAAILLVLLWVNVFGLAHSRPSELIRLIMIPIGAIAVALAIVWMTNLYNFMDGADGIAGGMTVIGFGAYAVALAFLSNASGSMGLLTAAISGAAAGFLAFNFPPAKVFMGDAGSIPLGFLAVALGIHGHLLGIWPWWFAPLVFSPFIVDASITLLRRSMQGYKPWIAHRDHYYQRVILAGWSQRKTALAYYGIMATTAASALTAIVSPFANAILLGWVITYALLLIVLELHLGEKKNNKSKNNDREAT